MLVRLCSKSFKLDFSSWAISNSERWCCESAALNMPANLENSAVATGLEKISFHSNRKERQCQKIFKLLHNCTYVSSVQFSSVAQSCPTPCKTMYCSTPGLPVHHQLLKLAQTQVHWVSDDMQPSDPLSSPSPTCNPSQYQGLFQLVSSSHQVAKVLEFQLQHQSF